MMILFVEVHPELLSSHKVLSEPMRIASLEYCNNPD
jgi:hypothetical protein